MEANIGDTYQDKEYWNYWHSQTKGNFEWFLDFDSLKPMLTPFLRPQCHVLCLGPGQSTVPDDLYDAGHQSITCLDFSDRAVNITKEKNRLVRSGIKYICADACVPLKLDKEFALIFDKGTIDCICCQHGGYTKAKDVIANMYDLLGTHGAFVMVSQGAPVVRLNLFDREHWSDVSIRTIRVPDIDSILQGQKRQPILQFTPEDKKMRQNQAFIYIGRKGYQSQPAAE